MQASLTAEQEKFLWSVAIVPEGTPIRELAYDLKPAAARQELVTRQFIKVEKVARVNVVTLLEKGWQQIEEHALTEIPKTGKLVRLLAERFITGAYANKALGRCTIVEFLSQATASKTRHSATPIAAAGNSTQDAVRRRIYETCLQLTQNGVYGTRVRLADLRAKLNDVPREDLDEYLRQMEISENVVLMPMDDPREIEPVDHAAALKNSSGRERHVLRLAQSNR